MRYRVCYLCGIQDSDQQQPHHDQRNRVISPMVPVAATRSVGPAVYHLRSDRRNTRYHHAIQLNYYRTVFFWTPSTRFRTTS